MGAAGRIPRHLPGRCFAVIAAFVYLVLAALLVAGVRALRVRPTAGEVLILVAVPVLVLWPWLGRTILAPVDDLHASGQLLIAQRDPLGPSQWSTLGDVTHQFLPWELAVRQALGAGRLPEWDERFGGGNCLVCNPQARVFDPIAWVARATTGLPSHLEMVVALQLLVSGFGGLAAAAVLGVRRWARLASAVSWSLGGAVVAWALFPNGAVAVWLPWVLAALVPLVRRRDDRRALAASVVVVAAAWFAGNPQVVVWCVPALVATALAVARRGQRLRALGRLAVVLTLGTALAAPSLLPFQALAEGSARAAERRSQPVQWPGSWSVEELFEGDGERFLRSMVDPLAWGTPYYDEFRGPTNWPESASVHAGPLALLGLVSALTARRTRRRALLLAGLGVWGWLVGGGFRPLTALVSQLPVLGLTSTTRALPLVSLALALVVGLGVEAWCRRPHGQRLGLAVGALGLLVAVSGGGLRWGVFVGGVLGAAWLAARSPRFGALALAAVLTTDLVGVARRFLPRGEPHFFYPTNEAIADIRRELPEGEPWRIVGENYAAYPAVLAPHGLADIRPHDPLAPAALVEVLGAAFRFAPSTAAWYSPLTNVEHPLLDFLGVRVVVSDYAQPPKHRLERIDEPWRHGIHTLRRNPAALPRVFVPTGIDRVPPESMPRWLAAMTDPRRVAISDPLRCTAIDGEVGIRLEGTDGRMQISIDGEPCLVASSIPWVPGWSARHEDGRKIELVPVNHAFVGLVEPGSGRIELIYRAPGLRLGFAVAVGAGLVLLALLRRREGRAVLERREGPGRVDCGPAPPTEGREVRFERG